ncbi:unnamed protein product [Pedinophyceae sp. YPF-701]|nr:unnamed protein product [Pedinophyceae sp. YPF-701]
MKTRSVAKALGLAAIGVVLARVGTRRVRSMRTRAIASSPPYAEKRPKVLQSDHGERHDDYYWLRDDDRKDPAVLKQLDAENAYQKAVMAHTEKLQEDIFKEMRGRIQEADQSATLRDGPYYYYTRTLEGKQYRVHCRRAVPEAAAARAPDVADVMDESVPEEVLLDENAVAAKYKFYMTRGVSVSPDHKYMAWGEDTVGGEKFDLHVKEIATGREVLKRPITATSGNVAWASDNKTLFYVTKDKLDRPEKVWRHIIGTDPSEDVVVFHEKDDAFYVGISRARSGAVIYISAGSAVTSYEMYVPADRPLEEPKIVMEKKQDVEYDVRHRGGEFWVVVRDEQRPNSEVVVMPMGDPSKAKVAVPHRADVKIEGISLSQGHVAVFQRVNGLQTAEIFKLGDPDAATPLPLSGGSVVSLPEPSYELDAAAQGDFESPVLRLAYTSLATPLSVMEVDMNTMQREVKKVTPVLGGFDADKYETRRLWATSHDGTKVPISVVFRKDLAKLDGSDPLLLDAYGAYEIPNDPWFAQQRLSLIDRGFTFAIAHVRGGGEMGRNWYEDGKYLKKKNTFLDVIACGEHLVHEKYTNTDKMCVQGRSAGGLTMGATVNMRPGLWKAVIMGVPFLDVLTTMSDPSIPLTVIEWEEWGNPANKEYYEYMKSYSPVDNVAKQAYPHILITAGLHDPRVGYWEPAKFCAKLREHKTDDNMLLFKCDMGAGHFSQSGRFDKLKETAVEYAFLLMAVGLV